MPAPLTQSIRNVRAWRPVIDYGLGHRNTVFLAGSGRSGTTWVAALINYRGDYRYITEPFNPEHSSFCRDFVYALYLRPDNRSQRYLRPARNLITGRAGFNRKTHQFNKRVLCRRRLIKEVRAHLWLKWLYERFPGLPIILLMRHPCAVALSRTKRKLPNFFAEIFAQRELFEDFLAPFRPQLEAARHASEWEQRIFSWCVQHYVPLHQFRKGEIHLAFYEAFAENPEVEIDRMFSFLGTSYDSQVFDGVRKPSPVTRRGAAILTGESLVARWQTEMPNDRIRRALAILSLFGLDAIYAQDPMPNVDNALAMLKQ